MRAEISSAGRWLEDAGEQARNQVADAAALAGARPVLGVPTLDLVEMCLV